MSNQCCVWDFTLPEADKTQEELRTILENIAKKWAFQKESGESGYVHWQGRFSLKVKQRLPTVKRLFETDKIHLSPTSAANSGNVFYVTKPDTRIEGPWTDADEAPAYIPWQIAEVEALYPWQQAIVESRNVRDKRTINILYDPIGNIGKTMIKTYVGCHKLGRTVPFRNDYRDIMRMVMDTTAVSLYIIDVPRAIKKEKLGEFFSGIESLKDGYAYDDRYKFKERFFDSPTIWIFMNKIPDREYLSGDRWKIWTVNSDKNLVETKFEGATL